MNVTQLPSAFTDKMKHMLQEEFTDFMASYDEPRLFGLRINGIKLSPEEFQAKKREDFHLTPIPWADHGFYYQEENRPGKHPYYHAGLYYIQEPSAMLPVELLDVQPNDRVLDLCAAPGGKSTQIAAKLGGTGTLVVNDIHSDRVKALVKNLELIGVRNSIVLNERPERMMSTFASFFDKILIDAPCSGEGMFRKEEDMARQWEKHGVEVCSAMQHDLLRQAAAMLAPGGTIVYSTCTFSPEENEMQIAAFLDDHPEFEVVAPSAALAGAGLSTGRPEWVSGAAKGSAADAVSRTVRLWPHRLKGEGHFAAALRLSAAPAPAEAGASHAAAAKPAAKHRGGGPAKAAADLAPLHAWAAVELRFPLLEEGKLVSFGEHVYMQPHGIPNLAGIKVVRPGWYIGSLHKGRFVPAHALAMGIRESEAVRILPLSVDDPRIIRYLKGETLEVDEAELKLHSPVASNKMAPAKGWSLVTVDGYPVGWGKWLDGMMKNEYPQGWRWT
ncbi:rRNA cytosine-C5-methyltransferase [Paenibacillus albiflavus]|uniref:rRNA cytosine-C5-methyltransferase n=1 Tax=Paenibacillus albiflavus TaxID=2545760 RepID=A0A4R4E923_9BACL|nr:RsmB/NOP family class I SAM-dependent RNA methyltransferase [Paenibacillus albiflavus]TCZ74285.1 rRNA cytosine-C5-methyltransferase [Paenibacillus albiflavus]